MQPQLQPKPQPRAQQPWSLMSWLGLLGLLLVAGAACLPAQAQAGSCDGPTRISGLKAGDSGFITDGAGNHGAAQECEWLLEAQGSDLYITLTFTSYATECLYDYLFVFDGNSYSSHKLAALSGVHLPSPITAFSGNVRWRVLCVQTKTKQQQKYKAYTQLYFV